MPVQSNGRFSTTQTTAALTGRSYNLVIESHPSAMPMPMQSSAGAGCRQRIALLPGWKVCSSCPDTMFHSCTCPLLPPTTTCVHLHVFRRLLSSEYVFTSGALHPEGLRMQGRIGATTMLQR